MGTPSERAKSVFLEAVEGHRPEEWPAFLDRACAGDGALRAAVERLLRARAELGSFQEEARPQPDATVELPTPAEGPGAAVGPYKLVEAIGEGGMGTVYLARQHEPVKRLVALKVIKPGMDSRQVLARFEAERQALALMDHPNIARVLDAGATESGRPYFVMELVKGVPITRYCDDHRLPPNARLELFGQVCAAVQHAHQKGVIHRDLKPSNVLVAPYDGRPVVKVIDFGIAKAAGQPLTDRTLVTGLGAVVGTPEYMSPEQAELNNADVDTRSDVYSLGVLLYELLTGTTPLTRARLKEAALLEVLRLVREEEPPRPSTRLSTTDALPSIAACRGLDPKRLSGLVRGELDWIVMKALEKDRSRRYETASGLAADVRRHLAGEAVLAVPPSAGYRLRKFARRNRGGVLVGASVALGLLLAVGSLGAAVWVLAASNAEVKAEQAQTKAALDRAVKAEEQARLEATTSRAVRDFFLSDLLRQADMVAQAEMNRLARTGFETKHNPTVKELLDRAAAQLTPDKIEAKFPGQPRVQAEILDTLGQTYAGIGETTKAIDHLTRALELYRAALGPDDPATLATRHALGDTYTGSGRFAEAAAEYEWVRAVRAARLGPDAPDTLNTAAELGLVTTYTGRPADAAALLERVGDAMTRTLGPDDARTLKARLYLAMAYQVCGRIDDAIAVFEPATARAAAILPPDHPYYQFGRVFAAKLYLKAGRPADAIRQLEDGLEHYTARNNPDHAGVQLMVSLLIRAYQGVGQPEKALPLRRRSLDWMRRHSPTDLATLHAVQSLAIGFAELGRHAEAVEVSREQAALVRVAAGAESSAHALALTYLGRVLMWQPGVPEGAEPVIREALAIRRKLGDTASVDYASDLSNLGILLLRKEEWAAAEPVLRECLAIRAEKQPDTWMRYNTTSMLGGSLLGQNRYDKAEPLLRAGYEGIAARKAGISTVDRVRFVEAADRLVRLCEATGRPVEAAKWRAERAKYVPEQAPPPREKK
jgi:serine/threonine protein kinase/tetratricopeptide (TPR) repeat protein